MSFEITFKNYPVPNHAKPKKRVSGKAVIEPIGSWVRDPMYRIARIEIDGVEIAVGTPKFALANVWIRGVHENTILDAMNKHRESVS